MESVISIVKEGFNDLLFTKVPMWMLWFFFLLLVGAMIWIAVQYSKLQRKEATNRRFWFRKCAIVECLAWVREYLSPEQQREFANRIKQHLDHNYPELEPGWEYTPIYRGEKEGFEEVLRYFEPEASANNSQPLEQQEEPKNK